MPHRVPHRRRAVPIALDDIARARSPARSIIGLWLALMPVILAIGSDGVWWQFWLRLQIKR